MRKRGCWTRLFQLGSACLLLAVALAWAFVLYPLWGIPLNSQRHGNPPLTPAWALECWVWEDDTNTAASTLEMVNGHLRHDFPVRTVLIDSPWSTRYNDFTVDPARFPNAEVFFRSLDERGIRVVLWSTCMVNSRNKDTAIEEDLAWLDAAAQKGFLVSDGLQQRWWKGRGGFLDYTNPDALSWWRGMQRPLLDWGIDGWKLDGTATLAIDSLGPLPWCYLDSRAGRISTRDYMDLYYREEYAGGLPLNSEFITLSRSLDSPAPWSHPEGFAPVDASPVNWLGDNTHTWSDDERGLERAIRLMLKSARIGYNIIGSDIAGYHGGSTIDPELYIRWTQFSAFCGLFLNGGHGERRMWMRSPEELEIVRTFSWLHHELVPYMYHYVVTAHQGGLRLIQPADSGPYHYFFGEFLLVAPMYTPGNTHTVSLPEGRWRYWFDDSETIEGPVTLTRDFPRDEFPVYVREAAIIPMQIERDYTGIGERDWKEYLTFNIYPGRPVSFTCFDPDQQHPATVSVQEIDPLRIELEALGRPYQLWILAEHAPQSVTLNGAPLDERAWHFDSERHRVRIRNDDGTAGVYTIQ